EAEVCGEAGAFHAACLMIGLALEAMLLGTALTVEEILRAQRMWPKGGPPERWSLKKLGSLAARAGWFPDARFAEAIERIQRLRNFAAHPGAHVRELGGVALSEELYRGAYEALGQAFDATLAWTESARRAAPRPTD